MRVIASTLGVSAAEGFCSSGAETASAFSVSGALAFGLRVRRFGFSGASAGAASSAAGAAGSEAGAEAAAAAALSAGASSAFTLRGRPGRRFGFSGTASASGASAAAGALAATADSAGASSAFTLRGRPGRRFGFSGAAASAGSAAASEAFSTASSFFLTVLRVRFFGAASPSAGPAVTWSSLSSGI